VHGQHLEVLLELGVVLELHGLGPGCPRGRGTRHWLVGRRSLGVHVQDLGVNAVGLHLELHCGPGQVHGQHLEVLLELGVVLELHRGTRGVALSCELVLEVFNLLAQGRDDGVPPTATTNTATDGPASCLEVRSCKLLIDLGLGLRELQDPSLECLEFLLLLHFLQLYLKVLHRVAQGLRGGGLLRCILRELLHAVLPAQKRLDLGDCQLVGFFLFRDDNLMDKFLHLLPHVLAKLVIGRDQEQVLERRVELCRAVELHRNGVQS